MRTSIVKYFPIYFLFLLASCLVSSCSKYVTTNSFSSNPIINKSRSNWLRQDGASAQTSEAKGIAVNASGNVYVVGYTTGALNGNSQSGTEDYFIAQYNSSGTLNWLKQSGASSQSARAKGVAVDSSGNIYVIGFTSGGLDGNTQTGTQDYFIAQYSSNGTLNWLKQVGVSSMRSEAFGVSVDSLGNVYVVGFTGGGLNGNTQAGLQDYFVAQYDSSGTLNWLKQQGANSQYTYGYAIAVDVSGNVYVAGFTTGGLNGNTLTGTQDYFVAQYGTNGTFHWLEQNGVSSQISEVNGVTVDTLTGKVYVDGYTTGGLDGNFQSGVNDYFLAQYDSDGTLNWLKQSGISSKTSQARGISIDDSTGDIYVVGLTTGGLDGNTQTGSQDYFIAQYSSNGTLNWLKQNGVSSQTSQIKATLVDTSGNVFVDGYTTGGLSGNPQTGAEDYFVGKNL